MNIVDSSLWIELIADAEYAPDIMEIVEDKKRLVVPSITIFEVYRKLFRDFGEEEAQRTAGYMGKGIVVDLNANLALFAAELSRKHNLPTADSIILATALQHGATLWTMDAHFKGIAGVRYFEQKKKKR